MVKRIQKIAQLELRLFQLCKHVVVLIEIVYQKANKRGIIAICCTLLLSLVRSVRCYYSRDGRISIRAIHRIV